MSTQSLSAVQSGGYTYLYDESTGQAYKLDTSSDAASIFEGSSNLSAVDNTSFGNTSTDYVCTDGKDDGKITADEAFTSAFKGIAKMIVSPVTEALKGNFIPAAVAVAGTAAIAFLGPVGVIGASVVGLVGGGAQLVNGINNAMNAETDGEAKQAFEEIGQGGFATLTSLFGLKGGLKQLKSMKNDTATNLGKLYQEEGKSASFGKKVTAYFKDTKLGKLIFGDNTPETVPVQTETGDDGIPPADDGAPTTVPEDGAPTPAPSDDGAPAPAPEPAATGGGASEPDIFEPAGGSGGDAGGAALETTPASSSSNNASALAKAKAELDAAAQLVDDINGDIYAANWNDEPTVALEARLNIAESRLAAAQKTYDSLQNVGASAKSASASSLPSTLSDGTPVPKTTEGIRIKINEIMQGIRNDNIVPGPKDAPYAAEYWKRYSVVQELEKIHGQMISQMLNA